MPQSMADELARSKKGRVRTIIAEALSNKSGRGEIAEALRASPEARERVAAAYNSRYVNKLMGS